MTERMKQLRQRYGIGSNDDVFDNILKVDRHDEHAGWMLAGARNAQIDILLIKLDSMEKRLKAVE